MHYNNYYYCCNTPSSTSIQGIEVTLQLTQSRRLQLTLDMFSWHVKLIIIIPVCLSAGVTILRSLSVLFLFRGVRSFVKKGTRIDDTVLTDTIFKTKDNPPAEHVDGKWWHCIIGRKFISVTCRLFKRRYTIKINWYKEDKKTENDSMRWWHI